MTDIILLDVELAVIFGVVYQIIKLLPIPEHIKNSALLLDLVAFLLMVFAALMGYLPVPK